MVNTAYIDSASLNVIFKTADGFVLGLDYSSNLQKIGTDLQALGAGFSVYLTIWPRDAASGDSVIQQLSRSGYEFRVNSKEIQSLLRFFANIPGIGDLYICDGLANYVQAAKLASFESVFYVGRRLCHVVVENRMVSKYEIYPNAQELSNALGDDFNCYGDSDLVDVARLRAIFPSLTFWETAQIVGCASMFMSARTTENRYLVDMNNVLACLLTESSAKPEDCSIAASAPTQGLPGDAADRVPVAQPAKADIAKATDADLFKSNRLYIRPSDIKLYRTPSSKGKPSMLAAMLSIVVVMLSASIGVVHAGVREWESRADLTTKAEEFVNEAAFNSALTGIYKNALDGVSNFSDCIALCQNNSLGVRVIGYEFHQEYYSVNCASPTTEAKDAFCEYVNSTYLVSQVNELGLAQGQDTFQLMFKLS